MSTYDLILRGAAKCAPPLRSRQHLEELWGQTFEGNIQFVTSDHSPAPPEMKVTKRSVST
jgi:allantoinase